VCDVEATEAMETVVHRF
jgi:structural maintenance of chromosome 3 (chondroitin sulfate proteoglycan 6)